MNPGVLDQQITFQAHGATDDGYGGQTDAWSDVLTVRARVRPQRAQEGDQAGQLVATAAYEITFRHRASPAIDGDMRIKWVTNGDKLLNIRETPDPGPRAMYRTVVAEEAVAI